MVTGSRAPWRSAFLASLLVRPNVFVRKRLLIVVPLVLRVYLFRVVSRSVRASRFTGVVSAARCVACIHLCRVLVSAAHFFNCDCRMVKYLVRLVGVSFRVFGECG